MAEKTLPVPSPCDYIKFHFSVLRFCELRTRPGTFRAAVRKSDKNNEHFHFQLEKGFNKTRKIALREFSSEREELTTKEAQELQEQWHKSREKAMASRSKGR